MMDTKQDKAILNAKRSQNTFSKTFGRSCPLVRGWVRRFATIAVLASISTAALSQSEVPTGINSPTYSLTDANGINLTSNKPSARVDDVSIGAATNPLAHAVITNYESATPTIAFSDSFAGQVQAANNWDTSDKCTAIGAGGYLDVMIAGSADRMCGSAGGSYISQRSSGSTMVTNADGTLTYTQAHGTQFLFNSVRQLIQVTNPDGMITTLTYKSTAMPAGSTRYRLQSVTRNDGLQLKYTYVSNAAPVNTLSPWFQIASIRAINNTVEYCDPVADACTFTETWPVATQSRTASGSLKYFTVTDAGGRATRFTTGVPVLSGGTYMPNFMPFTTDQLLAIRVPTSTSADTLTYTYCAPSGEYYCMKAGVKSVTANGVTWTYAGTSGTGGPSVFIQLTSTRPGGGSRQVQQQIGNYAQGPLISFSDSLAMRSFHFEFSLANRLHYVNMRDGHKLTYAYDARGNITQETHSPKTGSPLEPLVRAANYDSSCSNPVKCNKPNWVRDAKGNQTDYEYNPIHGGVLKVTSPPPIAGGFRPQVRQTFTQRYAWYKNASGTVVQAPSAIWVLTAKKFCRTTAALPDGSGCGVPADEVTTTYEYGPTSSANNLFLRGVAVTADGITFRTCYGYDIYGNRISETLPKAGLTSCP
jgi:YD repeat-containing protein